MASIPEKSEIGQTYPKMTVFCKVSGHPHDAEICLLVLLKFIASALLEPNKLHFVYSLRAFRYK